MTNVPTINLKGNDYATVPQRLKAFREANPRASVKSIVMPQADGSLIFQSTILTDKADQNSADATGTAMYTAKELEPPKAFEKLETVATGRALAILGYLNNGQIATSEEMLEFEEYKNEQILEEISLATHRDQFKDILVRLTPAQKQIATPFINARIQELKEKANVAVN